MMSMSVEKNFNLGLIRLDLHKELNAGIKIIATDIREAVLGSRSQAGGYLVDNAVSTKERKEARGTKYNQPLMETGLMVRISEMVMPQEAEKNYQVSTLSPNEDRVDIAYWNDNGTVTIPARPFWGISQSAENDIMDLIDAAIEMDIRKS